MGPGDGGGRQSDRGCVRAFLRTSGSHAPTPERLAGAPQDHHIGPPVNGCAGLQVARKNGTAGIPCIPCSARRASHLFTVADEIYIAMAIWRDGDPVRRFPRLPSRNNQSSHLRCGLGNLVNVHGLSPDDRAASQTPQSPVSAGEHPGETVQLANLLFPNIPAGGAALPLALSLGNRNASHAARHAAVQAAAAAASSELCRNHIAE